MTSKQRTQPSREPLHRRKVQRDSKRRWYLRHLPKSRADQRIAQAGLNDKNHEWVTYVSPTEREAKRALASLRDILGPVAVSKLLCWPACDLANLCRMQTGRQLIGLLWCLVVKRPTTLTDLFTFGRFMDGDDPAGEDWQI